MQNIILAVVTALVLILPMPAHADFLTGNELYHDCQASEGSLNRQICLSFVTGGVDMLLALQKAQAVNHLICIDHSVTTGQLADVVTAYLRNHPKTRHYLAAGEMFVAISEAFPCKQ